MRGSFYLPLYLVLYLICFVIIKKGEIVGPKGYTLNLLSFDDDKPNKSYLVLMNLFKISFRFVPYLEAIA